MARKIKPYDHKKNEEFPRLRVSAELKEKSEQMLVELNKNGEGPRIKMADYIRMAIRHFNNSLSKDGLTLTYQVGGGS